jgi:hypothetical protein
VSAQEIPAIADLEMLVRLWYNNHSQQLGDTVITVESQALGSYQLSISEVRYVSLDEAIAIMESADEQKH